MTLHEELPVPPFSDQRLDGEVGLDGEVAGVRGVDVRREVWQSLLSMLRVYAYAASLSHGEIIVTETGPYAASLEHTGHTLMLSFDLSSGKGGSGEGGCRQPGSKQLSGVFEILEDGSLRVSGLETQLDVAAIDWVEQLTRMSALSSL
jgi:hypothetical protein